MARTRRLLSTDTLEGNEVINQAGEDLGEVETFMIDPEEGRVEYAVSAAMAVWSLPVGMRPWISSCAALGKSMTSIPALAWASLTAASSWQRSIIPWR
jgi:hypothetical protein